MDIDPLPACMSALNYLGFITCEITPHSFSVAHVMALVIALLCLMLSGFVSASEIAFFSLTPSQIDDMEQDNRTSTIERLLAKPERLLATILIANNLVNVAIVVLCNFALGPVFTGMEEVWSFVLQTIILTFLILLFGEILPKIYSNNYPEKWARMAAPGVLFLTQIFRPVSKFLVGSTAIVNRVVSKQAQALTTDDLSQALEITSDADDSDKDILEGILRYGNTQASEIMTPRINITDINIRSSFSEVMHIVVETGYSRIPVYEDNEDNIRGILFSRDLLPYIGKVDDTFDWRKLLREPYFVPESRMIDDLLEDFRKRKQHLAIVVDEYGGTQGIVSLEDVLEEIVGDINDEYDNAEANFKRLRDNVFEFDGRTPLNDFFRATDIDEDQFKDICEDAETIAGMLLAIKGDFPRQGEELTYACCKFTVLQISEHRIAQVRVTVNPTAPRQ